MCSPFCLTYIISYVAFYNSAFGLFLDLGVLNTVDLDILLITLDTFDERIGNNSIFLTFLSCRVSDGDDLSLLLILRNHISSFGSLL